MTLMHSIVKYVALSALIFAAVGCTARPHSEESKLIAATPEGGAILTKNASHPRAIAVRHCAKYGKRYALRDVGRASLAGSYEDRDYILYFDCR